MTRNPDRPAPNLACPGCGHESSEVIDSRSVSKGKAYRRRRWCEGEGCGLRWTTFEKIGPDPAYSTVQRTQPVVPKPGPPDTTGGGTPDTTGCGNGHKMLGGSNGTDATTDSVSTQQVVSGGVRGGPPSGLDPDPIRTPDPIPAVSVTPERARDPGTPYYRAPHRPIPVALVTEPFLAVYRAYPHKDGKLKAAAVFAELADDHQGGQAGLRDSILAWFATGALRRHPYAGEDRYRPTLETVLSERRWQDDQSAPSDVDGVEAAPAPSPYCDFHQGYGSRGKRAGKPSPTCPECKHVAARARPPVAHPPESAADILGRAGGHR